MPSSQTASAAAIKHFAEHQTNWQALIPPLRPGKHRIESAEMMAIHGDAPKNFVRIREYISGRPTRKVSRWPAHIAKVGYKHYPTESITEQLLTRIGQELGVRIADSHLRIVAGQVRFLSRYFLAPNELLVHGIEIFRFHLDDDIVQEIEDTRKERECYTFQTVRAALEEQFPDYWESIAGDFVEMLAFDAIIGHNDRHPANWGVVVPISGVRAPRFSPIYDTARALFWNTSETKLQQLRNDLAQFQAYVRKSEPLVGWDFEDVQGHFELIGRINQDFPNFRNRLQKFTPSEPIERCLVLVDAEFGSLLTPLRRRMICRCLEERHRRYREAILHGKW